MFNFNFLSKYLNYFNSFYKLVNLKIFILFFIFLLIGIIESVGIISFLPLIQTFNENGLQKISSNNLPSILNKFTKNLNFEDFILIIIIIFSLKGLVVYFVKYFQFKIQAQFNYLIVKKITNDLSNFSLKEFSKKSTGYFINLLTVESERATGAFLSFTNASAQVIISIPLLIFVFIINPFITIVACTFSLICFIFLRIVTNATKSFSEQITINNSNFNNISIQLVQNFKYFTATNTMSLLKNQSLSKINNIQLLKIKIGSLTSLIFSIIEPFSIIILMLLILLSVKLNLYFESLIISLFFIYRIIRSILEFQKWWQNFNINIGGLDAILLHISKIRKINIKSNKIYSKINLKLNNAKFLYENNLIFNNIDLEIKYLDFIGLKGKSGSGKTTLINIIMGLSKMNQGTYKVNDQIIKDIDFYSLRKNIGYVSQNLVIFNDTIKNNLTLWNKEISDQKVIDVLKKLNLHEYASPTGLAITIDDGGKNISGGQMQRINLAREIIRETEILILDEPTSSLDTFNKESFEKLVKSLKSQHTIIVISHDDKFLNLCDKVYEICDKKLVIKNNV